MSPAMPSECSVQMRQSAVTVGQRERPDSSLARKNKFKAPSGHAFEERNAPESARAESLPPVGVRARCEQCARQI